MSKILDDHTGGMELAEFVQLLTSISSENPEPDKIAKLRDVLQESPELASDLGNLAGAAIAKLIDQIAANHPPFQEVIRGYANFLHDSLAHGASSQLEHLLAEQITVCWLRMYDLLLRQPHLFDEAWSEDADAYFEARINGAQRRFIRSVEALARVRKLAVRTPALQFNIGGQQIVRN